MLSERTKRWMTDYGYTPSQLDARGESDDVPLIRASRQGRLLVVNELIDAGVQINATSSDGRHALWAACAAESVSIADVLLKNGIEINHQDEKGLTVLMYAATSGRTTWVEYFLKRGADSNIVSHDGSGASDIASSHAVLQLLKQSADFQRNEDLTESEVSERIEA